ICPPKKKEARLTRVFSSDQRGQIAVVLVEVFDRLQARLATIGRPLHSDPQIAKVVEDEVEESMVRPVLLAGFGRSGAPVLRTRH
ncbi:hypothetical protein PENTCL1PPCAC_19361, partial [Pristionchus entomophagus]